MNATEPAVGAAHRSFRLTRPTGEQPQQSSPSLVLPERDLRAVATAAVRQDVSRGGCFSAGPAGVQVWTGPWDGPLGARGDAVHLGSVDWSYDTPVKQYVTVYRVLVTANGLAAGETTDSILGRTLALAGLAAPRAVAGPTGLPRPRDPFRSAQLRQRP